MTARKQSAQANVTYLQRAPALATVGDIAGTNGGAGLAGSVDNWLQLFAGSRPPSRIREQGVVRRLFRRASICGPDARGVARGRPLRLSTNRRNFGN